MGPLSKGSAKMTWPCFEFDEKAKAQKVARGNSQGVGQTRFHDGGSIVVGAGTETTLNREKRERTCS